jgi:hypothetical protein
VLVRWAWAVQLGSSIRCLQCWYVENFPHIAYILLKNFNVSTCYRAKHGKIAPEFSMFCWWFSIFMEIPKCTRFKPDQW